MLKKTGIELELLTDYDQHLFIEKGMRGGISMVSKRYAKANNPRVEGYDPSKPKSYIHYLDANNLYGWAMSQPLPTGGFRWVEDCDGLSKVIAGHPEDSPEGYILEVELEYPVELHDAYNAYPLAPERMVAKEEWMSEYQHSLRNKKRAPPEVEKLVPILCNKERYVTPLQKPAALHVNIKLVRADEEDKLRRLIASPAFARANVFDDDLVAIQMHKSRLVLNRPVYVGMSILDLSKHLMYDFYYNQMKAQYRDRCQLLYTDTDSLLLEIQTEDVYGDIARHSHLYDTSNYPKDHPFHSTVNKKVLGKMKDEYAGRPIAEYVGLRPKMYSILEAGGQNIKKAKGVKKNVVKKNIPHEQYKEALFSKQTFRHGMDMLRSERHRIYGLHLNKVSLSPYDSKRWIAENGVVTLAYGHRDAVPAGQAEMDALVDEILAL